MTYRNPVPRNPTTSARLPVPQMFPVSGWILEHAPRDLEMRRLFEIHTWERGIIERDELGIGIGHQNRRVGGDQELGAARLHQGVHLREKDELTLRRKSGLRLVEQEKTFLEPALDDREKCLPMRAAVQRLAAIQRVGISRPTELRVSSACVEQGSEMGLELGSKEIAVTRPPAERRPEDVRKRASLRGRVSGAEVSPRTAGNGQP